MNTNPETQIFDGQLRYPGHGDLPPREMDLASSVPGWSRLARGAPLGQKVNLLYQASVEHPKAALSESFLWLPGDVGSDLDACQIQLVLGPPAAVPRNFADLDGTNAQTASGEFGNASMLNYPDYPGTAGPIVFPPMIYIVQWGIGGAKFQAEIDAVNGAVANIVASSMRVFGAVPLDAATNAPGTSGIYTLAAFVGPGWPRDGSAQRTVFVGTVDESDSSDVFATPAFARDVTATWNGAGSLASGYVNFYQDPGGLKCVGSFFFNGNQPGAFRVPNGGMYFSIDNNSSGAEQAFAAVFTLSI
jgi:hypothetical protein